MVAADYPSVNVTYMFTDIEGSSKMTREMGEVGKGLYEAHLRDPHRALLLGCVGRHHGFEAQRAGDGHMFVFPTADDAVECAVEFQRAMHESPITYAHEGSAWSVRVRIGIHHAVKQVVPTVMENGLPEYPGNDTNYAARIGGLGEGGQILVSEETRRVSRAMAGLSLHEWPNRYLKSFDDAPQTVYEIFYHPNQTPREPGMRWFPEWYQGERNRFIERPNKEKEIIDVFKHRKRDGRTSRLVTLHAEGGMGKTRLSIACAARMAGLFRDGVHFVSLAGISERNVRAVTEAIGAVFDLSGEAADPDPLFASLAPKELLLVLDNYETVGCEGVRDFLIRLSTETPGVYLLVTGREAVGVDDLEQIVSLDDGMSEGEARELFLARARLKGRLTGDPTPAEGEQIRRILALTERIPLAVELAAAWVTLQTLKEIADGIERTPLGKHTSETSGHTRSDARIAPGRHESLERSLNWSYTLIGETAGEDAQRVFAAAGLFADSFSAPYLAVVVGKEEVEGPLIALQNASLVRRFEDAVTGTSRYRLHRFTRAYAGDKLNEFPEGKAIRDRFIALYAQLVRDHVPNLGDLNGHRLLDAEWRNAIAASRLAEEDEDVVPLLSLLDLAYYLNFHGFWSEGESLCLRVLERMHLTENREGEGRGFFYLGGVYRSQGRWDDAIQAYERSIKIKKEFGDRVGEGLSLCNLGNVYYNQGLWDGATEAYEASLSILWEFGDRVGEGQTLNNLGNVYYRQGRWDDAIQAYERSIKIKKEFGDRVGEGQVLNNLGNVYQDQERWDDAIRAYEQDLAICREFGDRFGEGQTLNNLGVVYQKQGQWSKAVEAYKASLAIKRDLGDSVGEGMTFNNLGGVYRSQGRWDDAIQAYERSIKIKKEFGDRVGEGLTLENIALLYADQKNFEQAQTFVQKAVTVLKGTEAKASLEKAQRTLQIIIEAARTSEQSNAPKPSLLRRVWGAFRRDG